MIYSPNFHFNIPSRDVDDIVDINQLSENFMQIDAVMVAKEEGKGLSSNDYTDEDKKKLDSLSVTPDIDLSGKQDKFAEVADRDGILTLIAGRELHLEGIDSSKDFSGWLKLLYGMAELGAYGTVTVKSAADDVKLSGRRAEDDSANINADDCRIRNLADPVFEKDAVNKSYLDGVVGDIEGVLDELHNYAQTLANGGETVWA